MTTVVASSPDPAVEDTSPEKTPNRQETIATVASNASDEEDEPRSDEELIVEGTRLCNDDQILPGVRLFRKVNDTSKFTDRHKEFFRRAKLAEDLRADLLSPAFEGWTKQGESHGSRDFITYYRVESGGKLKCRIESVVEASMYVPFLAVMNETDLYETWFPSWKFPVKLGLKRSLKLKQVGRAEQVVQLTFDLPFPLNNREVVFWGFAEDDGASNRTASAKLLSVEEGFENGLVPATENGVTRIDLEADFLFRACPDDHPALKKSRGKYPEGEKLILLTFVLYVDPKVRFVPHSLMNFCTRTVIGTVWKMILNLAEQVREGKLKAHSERIASKREEIYDWLEERAELISGMPPSWKHEEQAEG